MQQFIFYYGVDPERPYNVSVLMNATWPVDFDQPPYDAADIQDLLDRWKTPGSVDSPSANDYANAFAGAFQQAQNNAVTWFRCAFYSSTEGSEDPSELTYLGNIQIRPNGSNTTRLQRIVGSMVAGFAGRTVVGHATRVYAVGLLNEDTAGIDAGTVIVSPGSGSATTFPFALNSIINATEFGGPIVFSSAGSVDLNVRNVNLQRFIFKGVRRT